jgi:threonine/homoserine/homoserine lactone efflux protein
MNESMSWGQWIIIAIGLVFALSAAIALVVAMVRRPSWKGFGRGIKNIIDALFGIG